VVYIQVSGRSGRFGQVGDVAAERMAPGGG
jgi:hypothetical protein